MTIREYICTNEARMVAERVARLEELGAPKIIIENAHKLVDELSKGILKCGGDNSLLDIEMESREVMKGKGGKPYIKFNNGSILYFPAARYGSFIKKA